MKDVNDHKTGDLFSEEATGARRMVYFWPDGEWVDKEDFRPSEWAYRSDDYGLLVLPENTSDEEIERILASDEKT